MTDGTAEGSQKFYLPDLRLSSVFSISLITGEWSKSGAERLRATEFSAWTTTDQQQTAFR